MSNRPTETGVGLEPVSKKLMERAVKTWSQTWADALAELDRERAALDAAVRAYEAKKGETK